MLCTTRTLACALRTWQHGDHRIAYQIGLSFHVEDEEPDGGGGTGFALPEAIIQHTALQSSLRARSAIGKHQTPGEKQVSDQILRIPRSHLLAGKQDLRKINDRSNPREISCKQKVRQSIN